MNQGMYRRNRSYSRRRRSYGRRGRMSIGKTDLRMAALIIVAFVAGAIAYRGGFINPLGGLLR